MPPRPLLTVVGLAAAVALTSATAAEARIVPNRSIDGVALGDTYPQVTDLRGSATPLFGEEPSDYSLFFRSRGLQVNLRHDTALDGEDGPKPADSDEVVLVATTSKRQRDAKSLGPGVTERTTRRRLTRERCASYEDADRGVRVLGCSLPRVGKVQTTYVIRRGRVIEVTVDGYGF